MELAFRRWGPQKIPESGMPACHAIVLLHGMGGTGSLWRPIAAHLEDQFDIVAPDQRGHGGSRPVPPTEVDFAPENYAQDVAQLLDRLAIRKATVIGHSMGVRTAVALAHLRADLVRDLVLVDLGFSGPAGGGLGTPLKDFLSRMPMQFATRGDARTYLETHCPDSSIAQYLMAVSVPTAPGQASIGFPFDRDALIRTLEAAEESSIGNWLPGILARGIPTLALRGELGQVWSAEDYDREKARFASNSGITFETFPGTGHGLPFEKRTAFLERVKDFITPPN